RFILMKKNRYVIYSTQKILNPYFIIINIININVFVKIREPQRKYTEGN
ncbi:hypothetical protein AE843_004227, partial [Salmonella enterica subsp. enterica serovar Meleagridis]|nr:hypothetical protein [Salmonella enterica subsp. enterica serovar Meleagridis]